MKIDVAELLLVAEKSQDVWLDAELKFCSLKNVFSMLKDKKVSFNGTMNAFNNELYASWVECASFTVL